MLVIGFMNSVNLSSEEGLRSVCQQASAAAEVDSGAAAVRRRNSLAEFLQLIGGSGETARATLDFQKRLWDDNPVSATGQGNIDVGSALEKGSFSQWLAAESVKPLPEQSSERGRFLLALY